MEQEMNLGTPTVYSTMEGLGEEGQLDMSKKYQQF